MADLDRLEVAKVVTRAFYDLIPDETQIGQIRQAGYAAADAVLTMQRQDGDGRYERDQSAMALIRTTERVQILHQISDMERTIGWESGEIQLVLDRVKAIVRGGLLG